MVLNFHRLFPKTYTVRDALKASELFDSDVPVSDGQKYPKRKAQIMKMAAAGWVLA